MKFQCFLRGDNKPFGPKFNNKAEAYAYGESVDFFGFYVMEVEG